MKDEQHSPVIFCEWVKLRRKALDLTQDELARRAGCSVNALRKIESGDRRPSKQLASLLARALEIPDEDQQTFIHVARGELNLERLRQASLETLTNIPELSGLRKPLPVASPGTSPTSLASHIPLQTTPLIGREAELAALERLFREHQCRLLTLTGVGGIGKTRLGIEFAARKQADFPGGVFYISLTSENSPEKIITAIADVFGYVFSGPAEPKEQLLYFILTNIKQPALFIFDNLEHLLVQDSDVETKPGLVELISEFLQRLPNVTILGTSRERLNMHGEWTYELHGLSIPPANFACPLEQYDSVDLFISSAHRIHADFKLEADEQASLVRICQLVDGVPLAIELAAAWVGILSCQEIAQEIQTNMDFLTTSMRDFPERHRSIRATFDHSWKLLTDEERMVLCQLSVFQGGFDRNAAQKIAGASLAVLASLCAKSLVRRIESGRYDLHQVIRQYALSHLGDYPCDPDTYERHCEHYLALVRDCEEALKSALQQETVRRLTDEIGNIRAAWAWAIEHQKYTLLGQAGRAFGWYFEIAGLYREGVQQFEPLTQALRARPLDQRWQATLGLSLIHQALLYFRKGEFDHAREIYEEAIAILRPTGDRLLLADALIFLGIILHLNGEYTRARSSLEEGLVLAQECHERWFEAYAIYNLGYISSLMGRYEEGYEQMLAGLAIWRKLGDPHYIALGLNFLVTTLIKLGMYGKARTSMQESIALCEQAGNRWGMGTAYRYLGLTCLAEGQYAEAQAHLSKSLEIFGQYLEGWHITRSLTYLGDAARLSGEYVEARRNYLDALRLSLEAKAIPIALDAITGLGYLQALDGKMERALMLSRFILNHASSEEDTKSRAGQLLNDLEKNLNPAQIAAARAAAEQVSWDDLVKEVLAEA